MQLPGLTAGEDEALLNPGVTQGRAGLGKWDKAPAGQGGTQSIPANDRGEGKGSSEKMRLQKEGDEKERDGRHLNLRRN